MVKISLYFVDNSFRKYEEGPEFVQRFNELHERGYWGKKLIDTLFSDDWGAPPKYVKINGSNSEGEPIEIRIPYE